MAVIPLIASCYPVLFTYTISSFYVTFLDVDVYVDKLGFRTSVHSNPLTTNNTSTFQLRYPSTNRTIHFPRLSVLDTSANIPLTFLTSPIIISTLPLYLMITLSLFTKARLTVVHHSPRTNTICPLFTTTILIFTL